ncbi:MAG: CC0125/CC1285 family lipoprotein [Alphaproteobacteria bacterium]
MTHLRSLALITALAFLSACATTTPYQAASKPGAYDGYSQTMIENDRARVTFGGNSLTDKDTVENYLLFRAAELTKERGFDHFSLVERETEAKTRVDVSPRFGRYDPYFDYAFYRPYHGWSAYHPYSRFYNGFPRRGFGSGFNDPFFNNYDVNEITKYRASAEVKFGRGNRPAADNAFDAEQVLANLGPTIIFPAESD